MANSVIVKRAVTELERVGPFAGVYEILSGYFKLLVAWCCTLLVAYLYGKWQAGTSTDAAVLCLGARAFKTVGRPRCDSEQCSEQCSDDESASAGHTACDTGG